MRFMAAGGVLKDALKEIEAEASTEEMLNVDSENDEPAAREVVRTATWRPTEKRYRMRK